MPVAIQGIKPGCREADGSLGCGSGQAISLQVADGHGNTFLGEPGQCGQITDAQSGLLLTRGMTPVDDAVRPARNVRFKGDADAVEHSGDEAVEPGENEQLE